MSHTRDHWHTPASPAAQKNPAQVQERMDAFVVRLSLAPDRNQLEERLSFSDIRHKLFRSMDHLNLTLVYRFGLVLDSKRYYSGDVAMQIVSTLACYARPSVVEGYLRHVEDTSQDYDSKMGIDSPSDLLAGAYSLAIRAAFALWGKDESALALTSTARSREIRIPNFTLKVAKHTLDRQTAMDRI